MNRAKRGRPEKLSVIGEPAKRASASSAKTGISITLPRSTKVFGMSAMLGARLALPTTIGKCSWLTAAVPATASVPDEGSPLSVAVTVMT
jgi:hypothetical protein